MIQFKNEKEVEILQKYSSPEEQAKLSMLIEKGVSSSDEAKFLAKIYWHIVDSTVGMNMESILEKLYTSLHIHCNNEGFGDAWDEAIPE